MPKRNAKKSKTQGSSRGLSPTKDPSRATAMMLGIASEEAPVEKGPSEATSSFSVPATATTDSSRTHISTDKPSDPANKLHTDQSKLIGTAGSVSSAGTNAKRTKGKGRRKGIGHLIQQAAMASTDNPSQSVSQSQLSLASTVASGSQKNTSLSSIPPALLDIIPPLHAVLAPLSLDTLDAKQLQIDTTAVQLRIERIRAAIAALPAADKSIEELRAEVKAAEERVAKQKAILRSVGDATVTNTSAS